jgi:hypothetical protein
MWFRAAATLAALAALSGSGCGDSLNTAMDLGLVDQGAGEALSDTEPSPDVLAPPRVTGIQEEGADGVAVVGERIWLLGQSFGPNCAVAFGKAPALVLSASAVDLRFQVPEGVDVGQHKPTLSCDNGETNFDLKVQRYHLVTAPALDRVAVLDELNPNVITDSQKRVVFKSADPVVLSHDSAVAYVGTSATAFDAPKVGIIDMVSAGGPTLQSAGVPHAEALKLPVFGLATAAEAPLLAVAGGLYVVLYDTTDPRKPTRAGAIQLVNLTPGKPLPEISAGFFTRVALTPDGKTAAVLDGAADELSIYDVSAPAQPKLLYGKIKVSAGTTAAPGISLPLSGLLKSIKVKGGSAQDLALSPDGKQAVVLSGGGIGALLPETYNLELHNSAVSVVNLSSGTHVVKLKTLPEAHVPNAVTWAPGAGGGVFVSSMSSASAVLIKILFSLGVNALIGGGLDLTTVGSILLKNFKDAIDVAKAAWQGTLFQLGGLHHVTAGAASFSQLPQLQAGACATHDGTRLLAAAQGWIVDIRFGGVTIVKSFSFKYVLGASVHDLSGAKGGASFHELFPWQAKLLLPPWSFGRAACQQ